MGGINAQQNCRLTLFIKAGHADSLCRDQHFPLSPEMDCLIKAGGSKTLLGGSEEVMGGVAWGWARSHLYLLSGSLIKAVATFYSSKQFLWNYAFLSAFFHTLEQWISRVYKVKYFFFKKQDDISWPKQSWRIKRKLWRRCVSALFRSWDVKLLKKNEYFTL